MEILEPIKAIPNRWGLTEIDISLFVTVLIIVSSVALALGLYLWGWPPLQQAEHWTMDWRARIGMKTPTDPRLVFLGFSPNHSERFMEDTEKSRALRLMDASWPWNREVWAMAAKRLVTRGGADAVLLDLLLESPRKGDAALKNVLEKYPDSVSIGSRVDYQMFAGTQMVSYIPPVDSVVSQAGKLAATTENGPVGHVNLWPDEDGVVRSVDYLFNYQGKIVYSLSARGLQKSGHADKLPKHPGPELFRYGSVGDDGYRMYPFYQIFVPSIWNGYFRGGSFFEDKIVIVGPYGNWQHDVHRTPMSEQEIAGPRIHLHAISAALHGEFLSYTTRRTDIALILLMGLLAGLVCYLFRNIVLRVSAVLLLDVGFLALSLILYNDAGTYMLTVAPLIPLNVSIPGVFVFEFIKEQRERARVRSTLDRYISEDVAAQILQDRDHYYDSVGGTRRNVTVLFSDIRSFTTISEELEPEQLVVQLNQYLTDMVEHIQGNKGRLDKFIGDAIMAVWGDLFRMEDPARGSKLAVDTSLKMLEGLETLNQQWTGDERPEFNIGIGLSHGPAIFGNMGSDQRMELTVIGDTVNLAARMEGLTKKYDMELLMSEVVADHVREDYALRTVDRVRVKGKTEPTSVYTVVSRVGELENGRPKWLERHERGVELYQNRAFEEAIECFRACKEMKVGDPLSELYIKRCERYQNDDPGEDWDGVTQMKTK